VAYGVAIQTLISESNGGSPEERQQSQFVTNNDHAEKLIKSDTKRRILELKAEGYFKDPMLPSEVRSELRTRGFHHNPPDVRMALLRLAQDKSFRRLSDGRINFRYAQM